MVCLTKHSVAVCQDSGNVKAERFISIHAESKPVVVKHGSR